MAAHRPRALPLDGLADTAWNWTESSRAAALAAFAAIAAHCDAYEETQRVSPRRPYKRGALLRVVHEHAPSPAARDRVLQYFFTRLPPPPPPEVAPGLAERLRAAEGCACTERGGEAQMLVVERVAETADALVDGFFVPFCERGGRTPRTPADNDGAVPLRSLRDVCLARDKHRCVISRVFDSNEANRRDAKAQRQGTNPLDDEGSTLDRRAGFHPLEVAHIVPPALLPSSNGPKDAPTTYAQRVLAMLCPGVATDGHALDGPANALTLAPSLLVHFAQLEMYLTADSTVTHAYTIEATRRFLPSHSLSRTLLRDPRIDAPMPELLALHRACCLVLHASHGAGYAARTAARREGGGADRGGRRRWGTAAEYIDKVRRERDLPYAAPDGSTELGNLVRVRLLEESVE